MNEAVTSAGQWPAAYRIDRAGELRLDSMYLSDSWAGGVLIAQARGAT